MPTLLEVASNATKATEETKQTSSEPSTMDVESSGTSGTANDAVETNRTIISSSKSNCDSMQRTTDREFDCITMTTMILTDWLAVRLRFICTVDSPITYEPIAYTGLFASTALLLAHAGFEGVHQRAAETLTDVLKAFIVKVGSVLKIFIDNHAGRVDTEELLLHMLSIMNIDGFSSLTHYVREEVVAFGRCLQELERKLRRKLEQTMQIVCHDDTYTEPRFNAHLVVSAVTLSECDDAINMKRDGGDESTAAAEDLDTEADDERFTTGKFGDIQLDFLGLGQLGIPNVCCLRVGSMRWIAAVDCVGLHRLIHCPLYTQLPRELLYSKPSHASAQQYVNNYNRIGLNMCCITNQSMQPIASCGLLGLLIQ
jgi:hypothetical protein